MKVAEEEFVALPKDAIENLVREREIMEQKVIELKKKSRSRQRPRILFWWTNWR